MDDPVLHPLRVAEAPLSRLAEAELPLPSAVAAPGFDAEPSSDDVAVAFSPPLPSLPAEGDRPALLTLTTGRAADPRRRPQPAGAVASSPPPGLARLRAYSVQVPRFQALPLVCASPHSGMAYDETFGNRSCLDAFSLRRSEDSYVDRIFAGVVELGVPLLCALFPRAFVDPNREPYELDPEMFDGPLPPFVNRDSPRAAAGLGTIPRLVSNGAAIYAGKLSFAEAADRIEHCYRPYHATLARLVDATRARFGAAILLDCHSMPSTGAPTHRDAGHARVDVVLGDCHGSACAPEITAAAESFLRNIGFSVARNNPYAGGFTTRHYGVPSRATHALQIELNRALYMNEQTFETTPALAEIAGHMQDMVAALGAVGAWLSRRG